MTACSHSIRTFAPRRFFTHNESKGGETAMKKTKYYLTPAQWQLAIHALNELRNKRLREGKCIDTVNDTLLAVMNAKTKRVRVAG